MDKSEEKDWKERFEKVFTNIPLHKEHYGFISQLLEEERKAVLNSVKRAISEIPFEDVNEMGAMWAKTRVEDVLRDLRDTPTQ